MKYPENFRYTKEHEWVQLENGVATVGVTDFAQSELGEIVFVELPAIGKKVKAGDSFCVLESTKAASDVYAPVSGTVQSVNTALGEAPNTVNSAAHGEGWLVKLTDVSSAELANLMDSSAYAAFVGGKN